MLEMQGRWIFLFCFLLLSCCKVQSQQNDKYLDKDYWKTQGLQDVLPHWSEKGVDSVNGMFYTNLDRDWKPFGNTDQSPAMIARHLFGYSAGYIMSGDEKLIHRATEIKNYLISNCWDKQYGGWFDAISREGKPQKITKTTFGQVYAITGLTMYYFATKDEDVLKYINTSNDLLETKVWDSTAGGYYDIMNPDWTVKSTGKSFSSEITPASGYLFYLYLATRNEKYLEQTEKVVNTVLQRMTDPFSGWILESYDSNWQNISKDGSGTEVNIGHNIEAAWMSLRTYLLNGKKAYLAATNRLAGMVHQYGFNRHTGVWYANVSKDSSSNHSPISYWWIQAYGNMFNLNLYRVDHQPVRLENFRKGAHFWDAHFLDKTKGDIYQGVSLSGEAIDPVKANIFKASYHNMENALLNWLYLAFWVKKEPVTLHFKISDSKAGDKLYPLPIEEENYVIEKVMIDKKAYENNKQHTLFITLPKLQNAHIEVSIQPKN